MKYLQELYVVVSGDGCFVGTCDGKFDGAVEGYFDGVLVGTLFAGDNDGDPVGQNPGVNDTQFFSVTQFDISLFSIGSPTKPTAI